MNEDIKKEFYEKFTKQDRPFKQWNDVGIDPKNVNRWIESKLEERNSSRSNLKDRIKKSIRKDEKGVYWDVKINSRELEEWVNLF